MSGYRQLSCALLVSGLTLAVPVAARAEVITFAGVASNHAATVQAKLTVGGTTYAKNVWAGELNWVWQGSTPAGFATSFYTYCVDLLNTLQTTQTVTIRSSNGFTNGVLGGGSKAAWLLNQYAPTIHASGTGIQGAALQVAMWEAMYDSSRNLLGGNFQLKSTIVNGVVTAVNAAIASQADVYLQALYNGPGGSYNTSIATVLETNVGQDQITYSVAEPSTLLFLGIGLALLGRRQRMRHAASI